MTQAVVAATLFATASLAALCSAQVTSWTNSAGGSFGDPANWSNGVPDQTKEGRFELPGAYTVTIDQPRSIRLLTSTAGILTLDLGGVVTTGELRVTGGSTTLRHGEFKRSVYVQQSANLTIESDAVVRIYADVQPNGFHLEDSATLLVRGWITECPVNLACAGVGFFWSQPQTQVRLEGGRIYVEYFSNQSRFEIVNGSVSHSGGGFPKGLDCNGGGVGGDNPTSLSGPSHIYNGARIGGRDGVTLGPGSILFEGLNTGAYDVKHITGDVLLRNGAAFLLPIGSTSPSDLMIHGGASLDVGPGCGANSRITCAGTLRLAPDATIYQLQPATGGSLKLVLDGALSPHHTQRTVSYYARTLTGTTLELEAINTNGLHLGDEIPLLQTLAGLYTGTFDQVIVPELDGGREMIVELQNTDPMNARVIARIVPGGNNPCWSSDVDGDGDYGTDADILAFFACLGGDCCPLCAPADFNSDGDSGTDADIEAFFRILSGNPC